MIQGIKQMLIIYVTCIERDVTACKCAVLCYTLACWECERSTRHCMEFKITKDKVTGCNKMLLFLNKIKKIYSPYLVSVVHLAYFIVFWGFSSSCSMLLTISSCDEHLKTPTKHRSRPNRQQKPGKVRIFSQFYSKINIIFHCMILSFVNLNSIQCLKVPVKWKIIAGHLKGILKCRRMALSFLKYLFSF